MTRTVDEVLADMGRYEDARAAVDELLPHAGDPPPAVTVEEQAAALAMVKALGLECEDLPGADRALEGRRRELEHELQAAGRAEHPAG